MTEDQFQRLIELIGGYQRQQISLLDEINQTLKRNDTASNGSSIAKAQEAMKDFRSVPDNERAAYDEMERLRQESIRRFNSNPYAPLMRGPNAAMEAPF